MMNCIDQSEVEMSYHNKNQLLDTSEKSVSLKWNDLLNIQTDLFIPYEISLLYRCYDWEVSTSILDIGCGNGYFTKQLSNQFPEKQFTGLDISGELISAAKEYNSSNQINYVQGNLFDFETIEPYEVIVMRLIVQHLGDFSKLLDHLHKLLIPGGSLIILDANHNGMFNYPHLPKFYELLSKLDELSEANKTNRCLSHRWRDMAAITKRWHLVEEQIIDVPIIHANANEEVLQIYELWLDIIESANEIDINFEEIRSELKAWSNTPNAFAQFGIHFMHLVKNDKNRHLVYI